MMGDMSPCESAEKSVRALHRFGLLQPLLPHHFRPTGSLCKQATASMRTTISVTGTWLRKDCIIRPQGVQSRPVELLVEHLIHGLTLLLRQVVLPVRDYAFPCEWARTVRKLIIGPLIQEITIQSVFRGC